MHKHILIIGRFLFFMNVFSLNFGCVSDNTGIYESYQNSGKIEYFNSSEIRQRHLDSLNAIRQEKGLEEVLISHFLNSSAATHATDTLRVLRVP